MDTKKDHYEDIRLFPSGVVSVWFLISMGLLIAFPLNARVAWRALYAQPNRTVDDQETAL